MAFLEGQKRTAAEFAAANPVLVPGEIGVELDTGRAKFGNGVDTWNALRYWVDPIGDRFEGGRLLDKGETNMNRFAAINGGGNVLTSTSMKISWFTALRTETINNVRTMTAGTAAATVTLCRIGIYDFETGLLVASTANDATMWIATNTLYPKALSAPWSKVVGKRYGAAFLFVGTTAPAMVGWSVSGSSTDALIFMSPPLSTAVGSQSDLPAQLPSGGGAANRVHCFIEMTP